MMNSWKATRQATQVSVITAGAISVAPAALFGVERRAPHVWLGVAGGLALLWATATSRAQVVLTAGASADTTIYESAASQPLANGSGTHLFIGNNSLDQTRRALLRFDVSAIPPGSVVVSADLTLDVNQDANASPLPATVHAVTRAWCEGATVAPGAQGGGGSAQTGDATWHAACLGSVNWTLRGGDFAEPALATATVAGIGPVTWESTPELVSVVQSWVTTPATNLGVMLRGEESTLSTAKRMLSRETMDVARRPRLTVVYVQAVSCDSIDFNRNGVFPEDQDVIDFFQVLAGAACPYATGPAEACDIDFNNNGVFPEDRDVIDFFAVLAGGECS